MAYWSHNTDAYSKTKHCQEQYRPHCKKFNNWKTTRSYFGLDTSTFLKIYTYPRQFTAKKSGYHLKKTEVYIAAGHLFNSYTTYKYTTSKGLKIRTHKYISLKIPKIWIWIKRFYYNTRSKEVSGLGESSYASLIMIYLTYYIILYLITLCGLWM